MTYHASSHLVLLSALLLPLSLRAQEPPRPGGPPYIETSGDGIGRVAPDRATVVLSVETKGATAAAVAATNARIQQRVLDTLRVLGFAGAQVSTVGFNVQPNQEYLPRGGIRKQGYLARNAVRVRLTDLTRIGNVIDAALARGATGVEDVEFEATNATSARNAALAEAAEHARSDAAALAQAFGGTLGPLLTLSTVDDGSYVPTRRRVNAASVVGYGEGGGTPIAAGDLTVQLSIFARWAFVQGPR
jgi:uncharacterized protein YggE